MEGRVLPQKSISGSFIVRINRQCEAEQWWLSELASQMHTWLGGQHTTAGWRDTVPRMALASPTSPHLADNRLQKMELATAPPVHLLHSASFQQLKPNENCCHRLSQGRRQGLVDSILANNSGAAQCHLVTVWSPSWTAVQYSKAC